MRNTFIKTLVEAAQTNPNIYLLVGDLGFSVVEPFAITFPKRFLNVGVAEQNMIGVATGLALSGKTVFVYSIGNFPTLRCLEQIRNDVCYHNANVKIVAVGGGVSYGAQGITHHATEDIAIMRALPNMVVVAPGDPIETELATEAIIKYSGPCYLRLGKGGEPTVHTRKPEFRLGKVIELQKGDDVTLISCGAILYNVVQAAKGLRCRVLSMPTIKPLDIEAIQTAKAIITVEEHSIIGGLGSAVAECFPSTCLLRLALPDAFIEDLGSQNYIRERNGLSIEGIRKKIIENISSKRSS